MPFAPDPAASGSNLTYTIVGGSSDLALAIDNDAVLESVKLSRRATYGRHW